MSQERIIDALKTIYGNSNHFQGSEPEGMGQYEEWKGLDYRDIKGSWVLQEKMFAIFTPKGDIIVRIVEVNPEDLPILVKGGVGFVNVSYVFDVQNAKGFPVVLLGKMANGEELPIRHSRNILMRDKLPPTLEQISNEIKSNNLEVSVNDAWLMFIFDVLANKRAVPVGFNKPSDTLVRNELRMEKDEEIKDEDRLRCCMQITEQELLTYALADYIVEL